MTPYTRDLRIRVVQAYERGEGSMRRLAARFAVSVSFVCDLITRYRTTGDVVPKPHGGGAPAKLAPPGLEAVRSLVQTAPDATLEELCARLQTATQITVSRPTMSRVLHKLGLPRKKNLSRRRASAPQCPATTHRRPRHDQTDGA